jgi:hypothetical protein
MLRHLRMILEARVDLGDIPFVCMHRSIAKLVMVRKEVANTWHVGCQALRPMLVKECLGDIGFKSFQT